MPTPPTHPFTFTRKQSASNKTPRQINRNLVFNLVRTRQPISRADLARISGLQRSTISLIVEDLIRERWVLEGSTGRLPRGRRPAFLELNHQRAVIALDIHPAQTTVAVTDLGGKIVAQNIVALPNDPDKADCTDRCGDQEADDGSIRTNPSTASASACRGRADPLQKRPIFAPNVRWPMQSIQSRIHRATGLRVEMENVANASALSEVWFGDGDGLTI